MRTLISAVLLSLLTASPLAMANGQPLKVYRFEDGNGMVSTLNAPTAGALVLGMEDLRGRLESRCAQLERRVENSVLTPARMLFAAVMPGGLLFTAISRERGRQAGAELTGLNQDLRELGTDLNYWRRHQSTVVVARAD